ncbi:hypothetical protein BA177_04850 [Woeseia oceani]|uniref:Uncharacterized protein n=1 Tax=Woeseia oceani TaxID=1548547 RepID=A0A193LDN6_9GAMM|nr:hypothetical protein BA177_04850 [Woeseia oceani]
MNFSWLTVTQSDEKSHPPFSGLLTSHANGAPVRLPLGWPANELQIPSRVSITVTVVQIALIQVSPSA